MKTSIKALSKEDSNQSFFEEKSLVNNFFMKITAYGLLLLVSFYAILGTILMQTFHTENHSDSVQLDVPTLDVDH